MAAAVRGNGRIPVAPDVCGFVPPASQSQHEASLAARAFGRDVGDVVLLYTSPNQTVHSTAYRSAVTSALARLSRSRVNSVQTC
ncbi:MAG TPA: hypothetical protein VLM11_06580 [Streptosporangiaceae bacterium]|nr:hypothetical protein [Streptosporangiaceae bacterium]